MPEEKPTTAEKPHGQLSLKNPPVIEAVLDLDCDFPTTFELSPLATRAVPLLQEDYPALRLKYIDQIQIEHHPEKPASQTTHRILNAYQFLKEEKDTTQLVQFRANGFSFNRLRPYTGFDDYLPEIERLWRLFVELAEPVLVTRIQLRYINRIQLPRKEGTGDVDLDEYLKIGPRLPDEKALKFVGFLNQSVSTEVATNRLVSTVLNMQAAAKPLEQPLIFDIEATHVFPLDPHDWKAIEETIAALRVLKNRVFEDTLTEKCLNLFR